jgi:hypothetical protein
MSLLSWVRNLNKPISVIRDSMGNWVYEMKNGKAIYNDCTIDQYALKTVIKIIADTGKLANINLYENNKLKQKNYLYFYQNKPNVFQSWTDFIEDYLYRISLGTVYMYKNPTGTFNAHYFLDYKDFDQKTKKYFDDFEKKLILSETLPKENHIIYYGDKKQEIKLKDVIIIHNEPPTQYWYKNDKSLDAIRKVVSNSESGLDSKNINLHFLQKFLMFQKAGKDDMQLQVNGLSTTEREDIEKKLLSNRSLHVSGKSDLELKRMVENFKSLGIDEAISNDLIMLAVYYNVPIELVVDRAKGLSSQGEAKQKAFVQLITMAIQPKLQKLTDVLEFDLKPNEEVKADFNHLPFMGVLRKENSELLKLNLESLKLMKDLGIDISNKLNEYVEN